MMNHIHDGLSLQLKELNIITDDLNQINSIYLLFRIVSKMHDKMIDVSRLMCYYTNNTNPDVFAICQSVLTEQLYRWESNFYYE